MHIHKFFSALMFIVLMLFPFVDAIATSEAGLAPQLSLTENIGDSEDSRAISTGWFAFRDNLGGIPSYIPGINQLLYFQSGTTNDGTSWGIVNSRFLRFPSGWIVNEVNLISANCNHSGSFWGDFNWAHIAIGVNNEVRIDHQLTQYYNDTCTVTYSVLVTPTTSTNPALVSWFIDTTSDDFCSNDNYAPGGYSCNVNLNPPAIIPAELIDKYNQWGGVKSLDVDRTGASAVGINGKIYLIGGGITGYPPIDARVQIYDPAKDQWRSSLRLMPEPVKYACAVGINEKIYVLGGMNGDNVVTNIVQVYDTVNNEWEYFHAKMPYARMSHGCAAIGTNLYIFGGDTGLYTYPPRDYTVDIRDTSSNPWQEIKRMTKNRSQMATAVVNGKIFAVGGYDLDVPAQVPYVEYYNPIKDNWFTFPSLGTPRRHHGAFSINDNLIVCGDFSSTAPYDCELYDTSKGTSGHWRYLEKNIPEGLRSFAYANLGLDLYVISGFDTTITGSTAVYRMLNYHPPYFTSTPITLAKVKENYKYEISAKDPHSGDKLTFSTVPSLPSSHWLTLTDHRDGTATLEGKPTSENIGTIGLTLMVEDNNDLQKGYDFQDFNITVFEKEPPVFTSEPITTALTGVPYIYDITTDDPNLVHGDVLEIKPWSLLPTWLTFTDHGDGTATLQGTPGSADLGNVDVMLKVKDSDGLEATQEFTLTVHANQAPYFTSAPVTLATQGVRYLYLAESTDPNLAQGDKLTLTVPVRPSWLVFASFEGTANIVGTPTSADVGEHQLEITVTDIGGLSATQAFTITVSETPAEPPPIAFSKTSPINGAGIVSTTAVLNWGTSSGASSYEYCYDQTDDNACSNWTNNGAKTSVTLSGLTAGTTYYWHVRANNSAGSTYANGAETAFWSFKTGTTDAFFQLFLPLILH